MIDPIITQARELYNASITNPHKGRSHIWNGVSPNQEVLTRIIETAENVVELEDMLKATDLYAISIPDELTHQYMMKWQKNYLLAHEGYDDSLPETPNFCRMMAIAAHIGRHCELEGARVVELGGGNGQLSYVLHEHGIKLHVDIDIPESLYMAYVCTRNRFPEAKCVWVHSEEVEFGDADFVFIPTHLAHVLEGKSFDLFVNTASMGELPNDQIALWMNFVQQSIIVKYFYGLNRFLNTIETKNLSDYSEHRKNENKASVLFDAKWKVLLWELEPEMCRCPFQDPRIARYLEIMLERIPSPDRESGYMEELGVQDWWRYKDISPLGTHRSNQLVHDFTKDGPLYYLWNTIRVTPSRGAIDMMLTYLSWIGKENLMFEEEIYYQSLKVKL